MMLNLLLGVFFLSSFVYTMDRKNSSLPLGNNEILYRNLLQEIKQKIEKNADIDTQPSFEIPRSCTYMTLAVDHGFDDCVKLLLENGVSPNPENLKNESYVHFAARVNNCTILKLLIAAHAQLDVTTSAGTPLALAAVRGHLQALQLLLKAGANPNIANVIQRTPLMRTVSRVSGLTFSEQDRKNCLYALLFYRADLGATTDQNQTACTIAEINKFDQCTALLQNYEKLKKRLFLLVRARHITPQQKQAAVTTIKKVAQQFTVAVRDEKGNTPLHYAVMKSDHVMTRLLWNANPFCSDVKNNLGFTPVHLAVNTSNLAVLRVFLPLAYSDSRCR